MKFQNNYINDIHSQWDGPKTGPLLKGVFPGTKRGDTIHKGREREDETAQYTII